MIENYFFSTFAFTLLKQTIRYEVVLHQRKLLSEKLLKDVRKTLIYSQLFFSCTFITHKFRGIIDINYFNRSHVTLERLCETF